MKFFILLLALICNLQSLAKAQIIPTCSNIGSLLVVDEESNKILFETNSQKIIYPASLVKMMTAYLTFEALENNQLTLEQEIIFSARAQEISEINKINTLRINDGNKISVEKAIQALIVKSYNESAIVLAEAVADNEWDFVKKMNKKALELGMINTSFRNASGLHEEGQYTTASDLARLALRLKKDFPQFYYFFSLKEFSYKNKIIKSHNRILNEYDGAEGMKTGYTNASGYNLVSSATNKKNRIFSVVTGCSSSRYRDNLSKFLLDLSFLESTENNNLYFKKISLKNSNQIYDNQVK
jgi:D-alanyl-D-alanine carboxypeptidase